MQRQDHLGLLCDVNELSALLAGSVNTEDFLRRIVELVAQHMHADVCSVYFFDEHRNALILRVTRGLSKVAEGNTTLQVGEGLVGTCFATMHSICEAEASKNPAYKFIQGSDEELYDVFLAVPIVRGAERIGVLVVQRRTGSSFQQHDIMALRAIASQLAASIENARALLSAANGREEAPARTPVSTRYVRGTSACEGFAIGNPIIVDHAKSQEILRQRSFQQRFTKADLEAALDLTEEQLKELERRLDESLPEVASLIFAAHILMLNDHEFRGQLFQCVDAGDNPPDAVGQVTQKYIEIFQRQKSTLMREKAKDIEDLAKRILINLIQQDYELVSQAEGRIVIARELFPSDILKLSSERVGGIVLVSGGITSHVSILVRSMGLPLVIAEAPDLLNLTPECEVVLDATDGLVHVNPKADVRANLVERNRLRHATADGADGVRPETYSEDRVRVHLLANINLLAEIPHALAYKAEGVGLYRSEFPFMIRSDFPSEEEQYVVYRRLVEGFGEREVTIRTLDIGGDKILAYSDHTAREKNPALGLRSIRFSLRHKDLFHKQLRAILRAGAGAHLRIMFPLITSLDEFLAARTEVQHCQDNLRREGIACNEHPAIGMMVEVPSVVEIIEDLARHSAFFCIGTNDFIQYTLAVDRGNEKVAGYYLPHHPAVLRSLKRIVAAGRAANIDVSICGELAHDLPYVPFLLGIGVRSFSVDPHFLPRLQEHIAKIRVADAELQAAHILQESRIENLARYFGH